jgi:putative flippase GtrA
MVTYHQFRIFLKSQVSAFIGGLFDYLMMILLTEWGHVYFAISIVLSGLWGAVVNFSINRYWTFKQRDVAKRTQLKKFVVVVAGSVLLKSSGTYLLTELLKLDYKICRLLVDIVVALGFNYTLQKYWVFGGNTRPTE